MPPLANVGGILALLNVIRCRCGFQSDGQRRGSSMLDQVEGLAAVVQPASIPLHCRRACRAPAFAASSPLPWGRRCTSGPRWASWAA